METQDNIFEREIGGHKYKTCRLPAETAWLLKLKLVKAFGPALQGLIGAAGESGGGKQEEVLGRIGEFLGTIDPENLVKLLKEVCSHVWQDGQKVTPERFNEAFVDSYQDAVKVAWFVCEINYRDFFQGASQSPLAQKLKATTAKP